MAESKRKLAAILSADVAGYSRLMGADERAPLNTLNAYRSIFREHIGKRLGAHRHRPCCVRSRAVK